MYVVPNHFKPTEVTFGTFHIKVSCINIFEDDLVRGLNGTELKKWLFFYKLCVCF